MTALFYYPLTPQTGFHFLINLYFLYNYSIRLETGVFDGRPGEKRRAIIYRIGLEQCEEDKQLPLIS